MQSGRPSYTATYQPVRTGAYQVAVTQLLPGGLSATYWDNQWLYGAAVVQRVDAQVRDGTVSRAGLVICALFCAASVVGGSLPTASLPGFRCSTCFGSVVPRAHGRNASLSA